MRYRSSPFAIFAASHELRTPLAPVLATLTNWEGSGRFEAEDQNDITMLRRNVELEARLIDDLLDLTRIAKGKMQLNTEVVDLHDLLRSVQGSARARSMPSRFARSFT